MGCLSDTRRLALLIEERDVILEQLEIAETKYISSFRITTPEPSIADFNPAPATDTEGIAYISRPRLLGTSSVRFQCFLVPLILFSLRF
jgi:calcium permeable stress-gated cation channel